ncbi:MAG: hypothetical protein KAV40_04045, partial [Thermoplasmatales archaeon]|nr:hypothetical protein [Thermoplasmatales archaeon]
MGEKRKYCVVVSILIIVLLAASALSSAGVFDNRNSAILELPDPKNMDKNGNQMDAIIASMNQQPSNSENVMEDDCGCGDGSVYIAPEGGLSSEDIAALQERGEKEGWTFTVGESSVTNRSLKALCGTIVDDEDQGGTPFDPEPINSLPQNFSWRNPNQNPTGRNCMTRIKDQGNCGSCWAHSAMGALEAQINIANSNPNLDRDLSEQYMLSCVGAQGICPNDCVSGGNAYWAFWYMKDGVSASDNGALPESCFTYQAIDANGCDFYGCGYPPVLCSAKCASWQSQLIQTVTGYGYNDLTGGLTPSQIKSKLASGPVCLDMDIYNDFNPGPGGSPSFDSNGVYRWDGVSAYVGGHGVLCVGYEDSLGCWICKNSWGAWGNMQGFF